MRSINLFDRHLKMPYTHLNSTFQTPTTTSTVSNTTINNHKLYYLKQYTDSCPNQNPEA